MSKISRALSSAVSGRSLSLQDVFNAGGDLSMVGSSSSHAGVRVGVEQSSQLTAVFGAWRIISDAIGTLPRDIVTTAGGVDTAQPRPVWLDRPNEGDLFSEFLSQIVLSMLQDGNAFVLLDYSAATGNDIMSVLNPRMCERESLSTVKINNSDGSSSMLPEFMFAQRDQLQVLHIKGMTAPGALRGMSPISACAESIGLGLATQRYGSSFFKNDATPGGIIELPESVKLSDAGRKATREAWSDMFGGPNRARRVAILQEGASYKPLQISPGESQFLEQRKFTVAEICRIYGIPVHLLHDTSGGVTGWGTGMQESNVQFVTHSLRPYIEKLEAKFTAVAQRAYSMPVRFKLDESAMLRGATSERWAVARSNVSAGILTADEARRSEGLGPLPDGAGSVPWIPLAQMPQDTDNQPESEQAK